MQDTGEWRIVTDPRYMGTYNYVVVSQPPENFNVIQWIKTGVTFIGHVVVDVAPYKLGGNVRGPGY